MGPADDIETLQPGKCESLCAIKADEKADEKADDRFSLRCGGSALLVQLLMLLPSGEEEETKYSWRAEELSIICFTSSAL